VFVVVYFRFVSWSGVRAEFGPNFVKMFLADFVPAYKNFFATTDAFVASYC